MPRSDQIAIRVIKPVVIVELQAHLESFGIPVITIRGDSPEDGVSTPCYYAVVICPGSVNRGQVQSRIARYAYGGTPPEIPPGLGVERGLQILERID